MTAEAGRFPFDLVWGPTEEDGSLDEPGGVLAGRKEFGVPLAVLPFLSAVTLLPLISIISSSSSSPLAEEKRGGEAAFLLNFDQVPLGSTLTWSTFLEVFIMISRTYLGKKSE